MVQAVGSQPTKARKPEEIQPPPPPPPPPPPAPAAPAATDNAVNPAGGASKPTLQTRLHSAQRFTAESGGGQRAFALQSQFTAQQPPQQAPNQTQPPAPGGVTTTQTGDRQYQLQAGNDTANVVVGEGVDPNSVVPKAAEYYGNTPPALRGAINTIEFKAEKGAPITTTDDPNDSAAAQAGSGKITFFDGANNLTPGIFNHEAAHLAGFDTENKEDGFLENVGEVLGGESGNPVPAAYEEAAKKDGNFTSTYAADAHSSTGYTEDFADGYRGYRDATAAGTLDAFRAQYPNRSAWFESTYPA